MKGAAVKLKNGIVRLEERKFSSIVSIAIAVALAAIGPVAGDVLSAASYSTNGLVGHWDGIENAGVGLHVADTNYWTDLTGLSGDFAVVSSVASFTADGLKKNAKGFMATNVTPEVRTDLRTIEVVVSGAPASGWVNAFFNTRNQTVSLANGRSGGNREYFFDADKLGCLTSQMPAQETITVIYKSDKEAKNYYQNGVTPTGSKKTNNWGESGVATTMHIGGRSGSTYASSGDATTYGYTIHAIRLYNRELTQAEITRNATIDQIRFFGAMPEISPANDKYALVATAGTGGMAAVDDVNAPPNAMAKFEVLNDYVFPIALRAIPLPGWKFTGWTGDFSYVVEGSASTPVIVVNSGCGRAYHATFERDLDNSEVPYVTDGLVGRWDGIENAGVGVHDTSSARWVDLSGNGGDFIVRPQAASFVGTGLWKKGIGICATNVSVHSGVLTIEEAISVSDVLPNKWVNAVFLGRNQTLTFRNENNNRRQFFFDFKNLNWNMEGQPGELTVSVTYAMDGETAKGQSFYIDGLPPQNGYSVGVDSMYWSGSVCTNTWIGGRMDYDVNSDAQTTNYTVHALRFYNRVLTAGEVAYNGAVDRLRFRGLSKDGFAYRLVSGNVQCQLRAWMNGMGGTISMDGGAVVTDRVETAWVAFGTAQTATFTATPDAGWTFVGWTGDVDAIVSGTANDRTVIVSATYGAAIQAVFTTTRKYVQDGLIGFWDSLENAGLGHFDPNVTAWKDLTGISGDFNLNAASGVFGTNALYKVRRGRMAFNAARRTDVRTVEAVVSSLPTDIWVVPAFVSRYQHISVRDQPSALNRQYFFDRQTASDVGRFGWVTAERPEQMTVALLSDSATTAEDFFVNGAKPEGKSYGNWWGDSPGNVMAIGARGPVSGKDAEAIGYCVHAVRFYNRKLTAKEIQRNARQDAIRYFGQPVPGMVIFIR